MNIFVNYPPGACGNFISNMAVHIYNPTYSFKIGEYGSCHYYDGDWGLYFPSVYYTNVDLRSDDFIHSVNLKESNTLSVVKTHSNNVKLIQLRNPGSKQIIINTKLADIASIGKNLFVKIYFEQWLTPNSPYAYDRLIPEWRKTKDHLELTAETPLELNTVEFFKVLSARMQSSYKDANFAPKQLDPSITKIEYQDIFLGKLSVLEQLADVVNVSAIPDSAVDYYNHYVKLLHDIDDLKFINGI